MHVRKKKQTPPQINIITLGCSKNRVDSELLYSQLHYNRLSVTHEAPENSGESIVVINTCGFIDKAKQQSIDTILEQIARKTRGEIEKLYVTGCLSERYKADLIQELPEVDGFFGTMELPALLNRLGADYKNELIGERLITTDAHYAYLKISEGCDRPCSFCAIPLMRGKHRSRSIESLVTEAKFLVSRGVKEIMLIAQDSTYYGLDLYQKRRLADLLTALAQEVEGLRWIRLHYAFPAGFPLDILPVMRANANICKYLDMPLQHIADPVLKAMRRGITKAKAIELIDTIRQTIPEITLRTTMLVGFPGETAADFEELIDFVNSTRFDRLGVFTYSHEEGTYAYTRPDDVPSAVKNERADRLMACQQAISLTLNEAKIGAVLPVIIDKKEGNEWVGRTEADSPEVDNEVRIALDTAPFNLQIGNFYNVRITGATEYDIYGEISA